MSNSKFAERFKNKSNIISNTGLISVDPNRAISKPQATQIHSSAIRSSANYILHSNSPPPESYKFLHSSKQSTSTPRNEAEIQHFQSSLLPTSSVSPKYLKKNQNQSATPIIVKPSLSSATDIKDLNKSYEKKPNVEFKPYTIKDYYIIKPKTYYQLGGLGPSNVGTNEWIQKKEINDKRITYGKNVYYINASKLPLLPISHSGKKKDEEDNSRIRALRFARTIQKPPLRVAFSPC